MIELLKGTLHSKTVEKIIVICGGVGYGVNISYQTYTKLPQIGEEVTIHCFLKVREDDMSLYGFSDEKEKMLFLSFSSVSGVGPKTAMQILSAIPADRAYRSIMEEDSTTLSSVKGLGPKTAKKIILELKDKFSKMEGIETATTMSQGIPAGVPRQDAVTALISLGYKQYEASVAVSKILKEHGNDLAVQDIIKYALKLRVK